MLKSPLTSVLKIFKCNFKIVSTLLSNQVSGSIDHSNTIGNMQRYWLPGFLASGGVPSIDSITVYTSKVGNVGMLQCISIHTYVIQYVWIWYMYLFRARRVGPKTYSKDKIHFLFFNFKGLLIVKLLHKTFKSLVRKKCSTYTTSFAYKIYIYIYHISVYVQCNTVIL